MLQLFLAAALGARNDAFVIRRWQHLAGTARTEADI